MDSSPPLPDLPRGPVDSIPSAVTRLSAIAQALTPTDGLACFNAMYLIVTERLRTAVSSSGEFADPDFMDHLDVVFVNLYLAAIDAYRDDVATAPRCWADLFARRQDPHVAPMQFALAGMSAHITHDLPLAVVQTCHDLTTTPESGGHEQDYERVDAILGSLDQQVRESFETGALLDLDRAAAGLENVIGNVSIDALRQTAWESATALWHLRDDARLTRDFVDGLDDVAAAAGRVLMVPLL